MEVELFLNHYSEKEINERLIRFAVEVDKESGYVVNDSYEIEIWTKFFSFISCTDLCESIGKSYNMNINLGLYIDYSDEKKLLEFINLLFEEKDIEYAILLADFEQILLEKRKEIVVAISNQKYINYEFAVLNSSILTENKLFDNYILSQNNKEDMVNEIKKIFNNCVADLNYTVYEDNGCVRFIMSYFYFSIWKDGIYDELNKYQLNVSIIVTNESEKLYNKLINKLKEKYNINIENF